MFRSLTLKSNRKGALLIEALLIISILAVSLTVIIQSFLSSYRASVYTKEYSLAALLLENKMSELLQKRFIKSTLNEENYFASPYEKFRYHLETKALGQGAPGISLNEAKLSILWQEGRRSNAINLTTYLLNEPDEH